MCNIATATNVPMKNQIATYKCLTLRFKIVANMFQPNTTHMIVIAISIGHSNSAYSFDVVIPKGRVKTPDKIINCQPQKLMKLSLSLHLLVFKSRLSKK